MGQWKGGEIVFAERLLCCGQITGVLIGIPSLSFSTAFAKAPHFLMSKMEPWGPGGETSSTARVVSVTYRPSFGDCQPHGRCLVLCLGAHRFSVTIHIDA